MQTSRTNNTLIALWLFASLLTILPSLNIMTAAVIGGEYIPVGNDSLYHARRILDAAIGERGFYQFDDMIHAPDGSWLTWPWAYDYFMAQALKLALWINPGLDPVKFLAYVPVFWILVNTGLLTALGRSVRLPIPLIAVFLLGFAVSPLTQLLHGVGIIDHHFMELTFVLLTTWSAIRFFASPASSSAAILLGVSLGIAPAAHNSLFILQIPFLLTALLLWLQSNRAVFAKAHLTAISLFVSTLLIVLPSEPFQQLFFEFETLSVFHLYVAFCSSAALLLMQRLSFSIKTGGMLAATLGLLALPLLIPLLVGANYVAGGQIGLDQITEVASPYKMVADSGLLLGATRYYGYLILLAPLVLGGFAWLAYRTEKPWELFFAIAGAFGLIMLLTQLRFHPFGYWALLLGILFFVQRLGEARGVKPPVLGVSAALLLLVAMQPAIQHQLMRNFLPGMAREYAVIYPVFADFAKACAEQPGMTLNAPDDGHPVRYHTDCSVISNNFLLTGQHQEKLILADILLQQDPYELSKYAPGIRYLLVHIYGIYTPTASGPVPTPLDELKATNAPLFYALAIEKRIPPNFELITELRVEDERDIPYAQVYRINPPHSDTGPGASPQP